MVSVWAALGGSSSTILHLLFKGAWQVCRWPWLQKLRNKGISRCRGITATPLFVPLSFAASLFSVMLTPPLRTTRSSCATFSPDSPRSTVLAHRYGRTRPTATPRSHMMISRDTLDPITAIVRKRQRIWCSAYPDAAYLGDPKPNLAITPPKGPSHQRGGAESLPSP